MVGKHLSFTETIKKRKTVDKNSLFKKSYIVKRPERATFTPLKCIEPIKILEKQRGPLS